MDHRISGVQSLDLSSVNLQPPQSGNDFRGRSRGHGMVHGNLNMGFSWGIPTMQSGLYLGHPFFSDKGMWNIWGWVRTSDFPSEPEDENLIWMTCGEDGCTVYGGYFCSALINSLPYLSGLQNSTNLKQEMIPLAFPIMSEMSQRRRYLSACP